MADQDIEDPMLHLGGHFAELSAALAARDGSGVDGGRVVRLAARAVPRTSHCGLTLIRPGRAPRTVVATDELVAAVDRLQYSVGEGPCLDAARGESVIVSDVLATDVRWPAFGPGCAGELGVLSMMSIRLPLGGDDSAAINFYATSKHAFDDSAVNVASIFGPFAALAVEQTLRAQDAHNFDEALSSSRQIGAAVGIIMARRLVNADDAFELLRRTSQDLNRKLRDIASEIEETGEVPNGRRPPTHSHGPDPA